VTSGAIRAAGRHLGADTRDVLAEIGYSEVEIIDLKRRGVVVSRSG
jgi:crotonobetainyl-CoA:carnitine CoA-transferase CaiB-like acyl-CoA transferase